MGRKRKRYHCTAVGDANKHDGHQYFGQENFDGKEFSSQGKSFTMSNILINCDYENIRFVTDIKGDANGTLILTGKPKYDKKAILLKLKI